MTGNFTNRISFRLARTAVLIAFGVGAILSALQVCIDYEEAAEDLDQKVVESQRVAEKAATRAVFLLNTDLANEVALGFMQYDYVTRVVITEDRGQALSAIERDVPVEDTTSLITREFFGDEVTYKYDLELPEHSGLRPGSLEVTIDRAIGLQPFIDRAITVFFSGLLRNFLLAMLLYIAFYSVITKPLRHLVDTVATIDPEHPGEKRVELPAAHKNTEFGLLARQTNQAFDAVQELLDNLRSTNRALSTSEEALRIRSWELEKEVERAKRTSVELVATKERAEAANRAKSVFLANVSHELRTPLNAIIGFSSIMADEMFGPIGHDKYQQYLKDIRDSSQHLSEVLGEVLDLAKIEAGEMRLEEEDINITTLCEESATLVGSQALQKNFRIDLRLDPNLPMLRGDRLRVKQSVLNLLSNAVKFTPRGGEGVTLSTHMAADGHMMIRVQDHGIGIAKDEQKLIFSPFIRSSTPHSRNHEGTGLGLSLVKAFIDVHEGWITLDSELGKGSAFTVHFPSSRVIHKAARSTGRTLQREHISAAAS